MAHRIATVFVLAALLGGCGGNPWAEGDDGGNGGENPVEDPDLALNVSNVVYDGTNLQLAISGLDSTPTLVTYERYAGLDVPGYQAFKIQEDALDRMFVALAAQSQDGSVRAAAVADGGQFAKYFGGGYFDRTGNFDRPDIGTGPGAGQVSYAGNYAAVTNIGVPGNPDAIPVAPGTDPALIPSQPSRVTGEIFMNVNFAEGDNMVNGTIYNRVLVESGFSLQDVVLVPTSISDTGTFNGAAQGALGNEGGVSGSYGGIFGGNDSSSVAGIVRLTEFEQNFENEQEHGVFVLTQCGLPGDAAICDQTAP